MSEQPAPYRFQNMNLKEVFDAGLASAEPNTVIDGIFLHHKDLVMTDRREAALIERKRTEEGPENPIGNVRCHDFESFVRVVNDHKEARTVVTADAANRMIKAIFDFRSPGEGSDAPNGWGQFTAEISFSHSRKLKEWKRTLEPMNQGDFANFIEDHIDDILEPSGVDMLAIATDLETSSTGSFSGRVNLQNGNVALTYQDETKTSVEIPKEIILGIPLFEHGPRYRLRARLRYQAGGGSVRFRLLFVTLDDALEQEFEAIAKQLDEQLDVPVIRGAIALPW